MKSHLTLLIAFFFSYQSFAQNLFGLNNDHQRITTSQKANLRTNSNIIFLDSMASDKYSSKFNYDSNGKTLNHISYNSGGLITDHYNYKTINYYSTNNYDSLTVDQSWNLKANKWITSSMTNYFTNPISQSSSTLNTTDYDTLGNVTNYISYSKPVFNADSTIEYDSTFYGHVDTTYHKFNSKHQIVQSIEISRKDTITYEYDKNDNIILRKDYNYGEDVYTYSNTNKLLTIKWYAYQIDPITKFKSVKINWIDSSVYDNNDNVIVRYYLRESDTTYETFSYDYTVPVNQIIYPMIFKRYGYSFNNKLIKVKSYDIHQNISTLTDSSTNFYYTTTNSTSIDKTITNQINIYPNPAQNILNVSGLQSTANISIFNMLGEMVMSNTSSSNINVSSLTSGLYFLIVNNQNQQILHRFFKQ